LTAVPDGTNIVPYRILGKGVAMSNLAIINTDEPEYTSDLDFNEDERRDLAKEVTSVFKAWKLSTAEQAMVLGITTVGRTTITRYAHGQPLPQNYDILWRVGNLLAIFYLLRSYNVNNADKADKWVTTPNVAVNGARPVDLMKSPNGVGSIRAWLEAYGAR